MEQERSLLPSELIIQNEIDVSESKRDEEALQDRLKMLSAVYASMSNGLALHEIIYDASGKAVDYLIIEVNPAYEKITGLKQTAIIGKKATLVYAVDEAPYIDLYAEVASTGSPTSFETYFPPMDKHFSISVFSHEKGKFGTIFLDITELKKAEKLLQKNEERFRLVLKNTPITVALQDKDLIYRWAYNHRSRKQEEIIGKTDPDLFLPEDLEWIIPLKQNVLETGKEMYVEKWVTSNNKRFFLGIHYEPIIDAAGIITGIGNTTIDLTDRQLVDEALQMSEVRFLALITASSDIIFRMNPDWSELRQLHGQNFTADSDKPTHDWINKYIHPDDQPLVKTVIIEAIRTKTIIELEHRVLREDGTLGWTFTRAIPLLDANGEIYEWFGAASVISDRKLAEELVRKSEELFRSVLDNSRDFIYRRNLQTGCYEYISPSVKEILGYTPDEFAIRQGKNAMAAIHPDDMAVVKIMMERLEETGTEDAEYRLQHKNGEYRWVSNHLSVIKDSKGQPLYRDGNVRDITERIQIEQAQRKSEEKYKELVTNAKSIIITVDIEGRITFINEYGQSFFEYEEIELIGKTGVETIVPKVDSTGRDMAKLLENIYENADSYSININENIKKNGERVWIEWHNKALCDDNGNRTGHLGIGIDITARRNAEFLIEEQNRELIVAKEKAEENDNLKSAFLRNMSHEIRTPMNAIIGFSKMLDKAELSTEKRKNYTSIIIDSSNQLLSIITDVLTFSSIQTNQEKININNVNINSIIDNLYSIFETQASNQNITLNTKKILTDRQSEIYTDSTKVTQILTNFISNALKFTHEGFIEFGYSLKNDFLEFYVKDSGIGIKAELKDIIFERFRQANEDISKKYGGTGLGLAISKAFTELLGGEIWVQSEPDKGSTFYFTIPYQPVHEEV